MSAVQTNVHVEEWLLYFMVCNFFDYQETSLCNGVGDDYAMYRGVVDPRFRLVAHDFDTILGQGDTGGSSSRSIWYMVDTPRSTDTTQRANFLSRFMRHPEFAPIYFRLWKQHLDTTFTPEQVDPLLDQVLGGWGTGNTIPNMKSFVANRRAYVLTDSAQEPLATESSAEGLTLSVPAAAPDPVSSTIVLQIKGKLNIEHQLKARAQQRGFRAVPMNLRGSVRLETQIETRTTSNVVGVLPGRTRPDETILYSAHWDHLGRCPAIDGDDICNGALDNATGTSDLIELARRYHADGAPERSVAFIALTAEEQGLLGALYYMQNPVFPARTTVAAINMDGINNAGLTRDIEVVGFGKSEMDDLIVEAARAQGRRVEPDSAPEAGYFYRSDHLHYAQLGIPVLYTSNGIDMVDGGVARGRAINEAYTGNNYHKPSDEVTADWDMSGGAQLNTDPNFDRPDDFYQALIDAHAGLTEAQSAALNARLILLLANQVGDFATLRAAIAAAREALDV